MHERERWATILRLLHDRHLLPVRDLMKLVDASPATLRRDLTRLAKQGLLKRVHGGVEAGSMQPAFLAQTSARTRVQRAKRAIAEAAAALCPNGASVIINGGTTTAAMAEFLRDRELQVLTNSFAMAQALIETTHCRVVVPGGEIHRDQSLILSPFDADAVQSYAASMMFMSAMSVGPQGLVEGDPVIARAEAKLLDRAAHLIALVDSTKFTPKGNMVVAPLDRLKTLITDPDAPESMLDLIRSAGVAVIVVDIAEGDRERE